MSSIDGVFLFYLAMMGVMFGGIFIFAVLDGALMPAFFCALGLIIVVGFLIALVRDT